MKEIEVDKLPQNGHVNTWNDRNLESVEVPKSPKRNSMNF